MTHIVKGQFICMKWGKLYGPEDVNRLYRMVRLNFVGDLRFVCLTDDDSGMDPEVECLPCPEIQLPEAFALRPWRKLTTFATSDRLFGLEGEWLFLDLDMLICGPLDDFFTYRPELDFVVMQNWTQPGKGIGNTSVYRFRVGALDWILQKLLAEQDRVLREFPNSQTFISRTLGRPEFWPDDWCKLFKVDCVPPWPQRFWQMPRLPEGARTVAFPGSPKPEEALLGQWPTRWYKRFYKFIRPTPWVSDLWGGRRPQG